MNMKPTHIHLQRELIAELDELKSMHGVSRAEVIREMLSQGLWYVQWARQDCTTGEGLRDLLSRGFRRYVEALGMPGTRDE